MNVLQNDRLILSLITVLVEKSSLNRVSVYSTEKNISMFKIILRFYMIGL